MQAVSAQPPDLIVLDLGLPDVEGGEIIRRLRGQTRSPIVVLTVREAESDKLLAFEAGADDYITKPFNPGELLVRIRAALSGAGQRESGRRYSHGDLAVDLDREEVRVGQRRVELSSPEYSLLKAMVSNAGKVLTHRRLIGELWSGIPYEDAMHSLRSNISSLRRKLEADPARPRHIVTEPGVGYRLVNSRGMGT